MDNRVLIMLLIILLFSNIISILCKYPIRRCFFWVLSLKREGKRCGSISIENFLPKHDIRETKGNKKLSGGSLQKDN